jgi:hypothetical protein
MKYNKNCVDRFIDKRVTKRISDLLDIRLKIRHRAIERYDTVDYFNSSLYEKDFADIRKLRDISIELTNDCNKFLERISEQYSKLN